MGITYRRPARPVTSTDAPRPPLRTYGATVRPCELSISSALATKHMSVARPDGANLRNTRRSPGASSLAVRHQVLPAAAHSGLFAAARGRARGPR